MLNQVVLWGTFIAPLLSLFFLKRKTLRRYMPVAILSALTTIYNEYAAETMDWIIVKQNIVPWTTFAPYVYGAFFASTIWIFVFTFERFWLYVLTNIAADFLFVFAVSPIYEWLGIYAFGGRSRFEIFCDIVLMSFVLYGYQMWQEKIMDGRFTAPTRSNAFAVHAFRRRAR